MPFHGAEPTEWRVWRSAQSIPKCVRRMCEFEMARAQLNDSGEKLNDVNLFRT